MQTATAAFVPTYRDVARELFRILKPGGVVACVEMWVDQPPHIGTGGFDAVFVSQQRHLLRRYRGRLERLAERRDAHGLGPSHRGARQDALAAYRFRFDDPTRPGGGFRDYFFTYRKPHAPPG